MWNNNQNNHRDPPSMDFSLQGVSPPKHPVRDMRFVANNPLKFMREPQLRKESQNGDIRIMSDIDTERLVLEQVSAIDFSVPNSDNLSSTKSALHSFAHHRSNAYMNPHLQHVNGYQLDGEMIDKKGFDMVHEGALDATQYVNTGTSPIPHGSSLSQTQCVIPNDSNLFSPEFPQSGMGRKAVSSQLPSPSSPSSQSPMSPQTPMDMSVTSSCSPPKSDRGERRTSVSSNSLDKDSSSSAKGLGSRPHILPPCRVCGAPATGFHYGANTCEACKGFFRRSLLRKEDYTCLKSIKCQIRPGKRNLCAACRYQRCLSAGMSKEGIKTGRYTYEKRTRDILELKQIHTEEAHQRVLVQQEELQERFRTIIAQVVRAQERNHMEAIKTNTMVQDLHNDYLEKKKQDDIPVPLDSEKPVSHDVFMKVYQSTGIEIDDRRNVMESWICTAERGLRQMVNFAKDLPGFRALCLGDQIILLKNSIAEAWVITRHKAFNHAHGCYTAYNGFTFDIYKAFDKEMVETILVIVKRLQKLNLTFEETCVLKATAFFFSDRCKLEAPEKVDDCLYELIETLDYLVRKNHPEKTQMLAHLILIMADLRNVTEMYHRQNEKVLCWTNVKKAPLIWEVMSYTPSVAKSPKAGTSEECTATDCKVKYGEDTPTAYPTLE